MTEDIQKLPTKSFLALLKKGQEKAYKIALLYSLIESGNLDWSSFMSPSQFYIRWSSLEIQTDHKTNMFIDG